MDGGVISQAKSGLGAPVSLGPKGKVLLVQDSTFTLIPHGSRVRSKAVSFSKLQAGDYALLTIDGKVAVRRFVGLDLTKGSTRLVLVDGQDKEITLPFTRLLGRVALVRRGERNLDPNPANFLHRATFRLRHQFVRRTEPAA